MYTVSDIKYRNNFELNHIIFTSKTKEFRLNVGKRNTKNDLQSKDDDTQRRV